MANQILLVTPGDHMGQRELFAAKPDTPVTPIGRSHCHVVSASIRALDVSMLCHGPAFRASLTAKLISIVHEGLFPREVPGLDEVNTGRWQGLTIAEVQQDPEWKNWLTSPDDFRFPGGETMAEAGNRLMKVLNGLPAHPDRPIVLVTHPGTIRAALAQILGCSIASVLKLGFTPVGITQLFQNDEGWTVGGINLRGAYRLATPVNTGGWPKDIEAVGEHWAPGGRTRLDF